MMRRKRTDARSCTHGKQCQNKSIDLSNKHLSAKYAVLLETLAYVTARRIDTWGTSFTRGPAKFWYAVIEMRPEMPSSLTVLNATTDATLRCSVILVKGCCCWPSCPDTCVFVEEWVLNRVSTKKSADTAAATAGMFKVSSHVPLRATISTSS